MKGKRITFLVSLLLLVTIVAGCAQQKSRIFDKGAKNVVLGLGTGANDSVLYIDTDEPPVSATPTPIPSVTVTVTVTPTVTEPVVTTPPDVYGSYEEEDCCILVSDLKIYPGMNFKGKEEVPGKIVKTLEGVSCMDAGYDINYYYDGLNVSTLSKDGQQIVFSAGFDKKIAETSKHITIGSTENEVLAAYGVPDENVITRQTYMKGYKSLSFFYENGIVTEIMIVDQSVN